MLHSFGQSMHMNKARFKGKGNMGRYEKMTMSMYSTTESKKEIEKVNQETVGSWGRKSFRKWRIVSTVKCSLEIQQQKTGEDCVKHGNSGVSRNFTHTVLDEAVGNKMVTNFWKAEK